MRIGIGLPAAIPGAAASELGDWAAAAEHHDFRSLGVIDRLVYDNLEPLVALAAAAARTERIELLTTVLNVPYRRNAVVLAKQLASVDAISGGRLTAGLALGGWPEDHAAVGPSSRGPGAVMDDMLATMHAAWRGALAGASGPMPATPPGRPRLLFGGFAPATFARAARFGDGWVAPSFGLEALTGGMTAVAAAWRAAGRPDRPRVVVERYFCLGRGAAATAEHYLAHYYGPDYLPAVVADTVTTLDQLEAELARLHATGCDDVVLLPCDADLRQVALLADALAAIGAAIGAANGPDRITA
jgi:alkanesulfonate monooxygenase SsuD/methylene tetrahydromethanopterin reductase-like flavin-dependent oxidoreductase (luciferase family)